MKKGFTLVELLVVLLVISIASAWVIPRFVRPLGGLEVKSAARHVLSSLRYARNLSVSQKSVILAHFDLAGHRLIIVAEEAQNPRAPGLRRTDFLLQNKKRYRMLESYDFPEDVEIKNAGAYQPRNETDFFQLRFFPSGRSTGGGVVFAGQSKTRYRVNIDFITGMASLSQVD